VYGSICLEYASFVVVSFEFTMVPLSESGFNTLLNIPALISAPDHLRLFSLPVLIDASGAQSAGAPA
jgi:hypothetical protein